MANEEDVVTIYRQVIQEELRRIHDGRTWRESTVGAGATAEEVLRHLAQRYDKLEREVAMLRTIMQRLVSDPVDAHQGGPATGDGDVAQAENLHS